MVEINNTTGQKINLAKTKKIIEEFLRVYKKTKWEVSLAIVGAKRMRKLNNDYRGINKTTDVLSFSGDGTQKKYLGEVVINIEEVKKANKYLEVFALKKSGEYIFYFLLVHGLLHLIGHEDDKENDRQKMLLIGEKFLLKYF
ncbi:MAG: rRNA maturation RNase YbeY [Candidatus Falkowbacteria bacterium]